MADVVEDVRGTVRSYLQTIFDDQFQEFDDGARFVGVQGSAIIQVIVRPWHEEDAIVECLSYVVSDAKLHEGLLYFLLRLNSKLHFGGFGINFDGTITFSHSIPGKNLDENELDASLRTVMRVADFYDDEIVKMSGGKRGEDIWEELWSELQG